MPPLDTASDSADETVDKIVRTANARDEKEEQLNTAERQMLNDCRDYIHDNPITSFAVAVAAGFFLSRSFVR